MNQSSFTGVSCASATACIATGEFEAYFVAAEWNGRRWTPNSLSASARGIACASGPMCMSVIPPAGNTGWIPLVWNGQRWSDAPLPPALPDGDIGTPSGVSCSSMTRCMVVGNEADGLFSATWNGQWSYESMPVPPGVTFPLDDPGPLGAVSCSSASACTAISSSFGDGQTPFAEHWDGQQWTAETIPQPPGQAITLSAVSCASRNNCMVVGQQAGHALKPYAAHWNGRVWSLTPTPTPDPSALNTLTGVSCPTNNTCVAVGTWSLGSTAIGVATAAGPVIERWNGKQWSIEKPGRWPAGQIEASFNSVSCASVNDCMAVGAIIEGTSLEDAIIPFAETSSSPSLHRPHSSAA